MHDKIDERSSQTTGSTPKQEVGQGICGGVQICLSTPVDKPGEILLTPTKGGKEDERGRRPGVHQPRTERRCGGGNLCWKTREQDGRRMISRRIRDLG